jgi:hypothetical protein
MSIRGGGRKSDTLPTPPRGQPQNNVINHLYLSQSNIKLFSFTWQMCFSGDPGTTIRISDFGVQDSLYCYHCCTSQSVGFFGGIFVGVKPQQL